MKVLLAATGGSGDELVVSEPVASGSDNFRADYQQQRKFDPSEARGGNNKTMQADVSDDDEDDLRDRFTGRCVVSDAYGRQSSFDSRGSNDRGG